MQWVLDTEQNKLVTRADIWAARLGRIEAVWGEDRYPQKVLEILNQGVVCPECRNPVHAQSHKKPGLWEMAATGSEPRAFGYAHYLPSSARNKGIKPVEACSLYCSEDPRFANKTPSEDEATRRSKIHRFLCQAGIKELNGRVLRALYFAAAQQEITQRGIGFYAGIAKSFMNRDVLQNHPYLLPYMVISQTPFFTRPDGQTCRFVEKGERQIVCGNRVALISKELALIVFGEKAEWQEGAFTISADAAEKLARTYQPPPQVKEGACSLLLSPFQPPLPRQKKGQTGLSYRNARASAPNQSRLPCVA